MVMTNERSPMAASIRPVAATCAKAPPIAHGQNPQPGRGSGTFISSIRTSRKIAANGKPNRNRTWVAPTVPRLAVSSRCVALRTVWAKAAMTVNTAHSHGMIVTCICTAWPRALDAPQSRRLLRDDHVIHVHVGRELPAVGKQIVDDAGFVAQPQPALLDRDLELVGGDELLPLMSAARQPAQDIFGADDRERK